jgi:hypothetical protein
MTDVFISYKREDHVRVDRLASLLKEFQLSVWHDAALGAGESWHERIMVVAERAKCIVVCWTDEAAKSRWVLGEVEIGLRREVLVPTAWAPCMPPPRLAHLHMANMTDWAGGNDHKGLLQLAGGVERFVGRKLSAKLRERAGGENPEVVARLRALLVRIARKGGAPISYRKAFYTVANAWAHGTKTSFEALYGALDVIADQNRARREPPLFALVVSKEGVPGRGYFQKHCFLEGADSDEARALHAAHLQRVYDYDWPNDP